MFSSEEHCGGGFKVRALSGFLLSLALVAATGSAQAGHGPVRTGTGYGKQPVTLQRGEASFYHDEFEGKKTATGETFSQQKLTAASRVLPLGSRVTVTNVENGKQVTVKINDRGPYVDGRVIDLSKKAARKLGIVKQGVAPVRVEARPSRQPTAELKEAVEAMAEETPVAQAAE
jgi:rare lipoprotein A